MHLQQAPTCPLPSSLYNQPHTQPFNTAIPLSHSTGIQSASHRTHAHAKWAHPPPGAPPACQPPWAVILPTHQAAPDIREQTEHSGTLFPYLCTAAPSHSPTFCLDVTPRFRYGAIPRSLLSGTGTLRAPTHTGPSGSSTGACLPCSPWSTAGSKGQT